MAVYRVYVEKKTEFAIEANEKKHEIKDFLKISSLEDLRIINRYDVEGISENVFKDAIKTVFSEPQVDNCYFDLENGGGNIFAVELLPGQYDQRADSAAQCIQIVAKIDRPKVMSAKVYMLYGNLSNAELSVIKKHLINPVESREASLEQKTTLEMDMNVPEDILPISGWLSLESTGLAAFAAENSLAMDLADLLCLQNYFRSENRNPTMTEIKVLDTYWSDHCRHTTFLTVIENVSIEEPVIDIAYKEYLEHKKELYPDNKRFTTLMDVATIGAKYLKKRGLLKNLDESEEINACSIKIEADVNGKIEPWLLMFKNETHNHPTEIEPFGGAATCIGGAIRDPLSGRSYVYQAMRVTGAANPLESAEKTLKGKLPQHKIVTTAAAGYSSYGNQIGLSTGHVKEIYHEGYRAKRMEVGAVLGAAPAENIIRERPQPGDAVILLGGRTGRDGCGGATGSSKSHSVSSLESCGAEVQKGNAPEERKIQRLFRNKKVSTMIKRCNDFGAGGVSVAIGELADGLIINLDKVLKKYDGLNGTELAISESQERMAVVVNKSDAEKFIEYASEENLEAIIVAEVTDKKRLQMLWRDKLLVDISRDFLNSNGAQKYANVKIGRQTLKKKYFKGNCLKDMEKLVEDLNICSQRGLVERFDSTIGSATVVMPYGGKNQSTPTQSMCAKIPVLDGETKTCSVMSVGFDPYLSEDPFYGAYYAVYESVAKIIAAGASRKDIYLSFQEYFERLRNEAKRWGKPFSALLGALKAQIELETAAIGGKDSMSGSFEQIDVPPTLISFAVAPGNVDNIISPEFKKAGNVVKLFAPKKTSYGLIDRNSALKCYERVEELIKKKIAVSSWAVGIGGIAEGIFKMSLGNDIGFEFSKIVDKASMYDYNYGGILLELTEDTIDGELMGKTLNDCIIVHTDEKISVNQLKEAYNGKLESVFPCKTKSEGKVDAFEFALDSSAFIKPPKAGIAQPKVLIPVFPGTNCEYDTKKAFETVGGKAEILVLRNLTADDVEYSVKKLTQLINSSQIIALPGGFSGGDEPDGSGKFITAFFRNPAVSEAVTELLEKRNGLIIGICNGFQALIKLGLVPFGKITETDETCPTLTYNQIGRHQSRLVHTRICSNKSPWLWDTKPGDVFTVAVSHGEGRFVASEATVKNLAENGQITTQYVDLDGKPTMDADFNPNGAMYAIEGITSPDGRIFGKMGHTERSGDSLYKNVPANYQTTLFKNGINYFK